MKELKSLGEQLAGILKEKVINRKARVAVIGLGYVGLPMAVELAKGGFFVTGIDRDAGKVEKINMGKSYNHDIPDEILKELVENRLLRAHNTYDLLNYVDIIIICVPTPLKSMKDPDLSHVLFVTREVACHLKQGQLICLESTTYPGTTQDVILPLLESTGLTVGKDFFLAFSPERVDPGNKSLRLEDISKVVGGVTDLCREVACAFYKQIIKHIVPVTSTRIAEMTKIFENTYRAVNIALVNEFMILCDRMGLDIWEIVDAAATKPFGIQTFYPGPGVGGHCIPVDPFYLARKALEYDFRIRFIDLAAEINIKAVEHVVNKLIILLNQYNKCLKDSKILVLGVAYKRDIDDIRESPALKIISYLLLNQCEVVYYDPYVPQFLFSGKIEKRMESISLTEQEIAGVDCVLIVTDHSCIDYQWVAEHARLILDTRNATKNVSKSKAIIKKI